MVMMLKKSGKKSKKRAIHYPRLALLVLSLAVAYLIFHGRDFSPFHNALLALGYFGTFLGGLFYAYGFTAAPATALLLIFGKEQNILTAALFGGAGALIGDIVIFLFVKNIFNDELRRLSHTRIAKIIEKEEKKVFGRFKKYVIALFAEFLIASPLPSEVGVSILASIKSMSLKKFALIAYVTHTIGILIILLIGKWI